MDQGSGTPGGSQVNLLGGTPDEVGRPGGSRTRSVTTTVSDTCKRRRRRVMFSDDDDDDDDNDAVC